MESWGKDVPSETAWVGLASVNKWDVKEAKGICHEVTGDRRVPTEGRVREATRATFEVAVASTLQAGKSSREPGRGTQCRASEGKASPNLNKGAPRSEPCCRGLTPGTTCG